jgi:hypothetical protein
VIAKLFEAGRPGVWWAFTRTSPDRARNKQYVQAEPTPPAECRFTAMCLPGELDDSSDAEWYVYDLMFRTSDKVGAGPQSRSSRFGRRVNQIAHGSRASARNGSVSRPELRWLVVTRAAALNSWP